MEMGVPSVWPSKVPERIWQVSLSLRGWAIERFHLLVGLGTLVLVADPDGDGRAERLAVEGAGEDLAGIAFLARRDDLALAGTAAVQIDLDVGFGQRDARRAAVDDHADAASVGLAPGGDLEERAYVV